MPNKFEFIHSVSLFIILSLLPFASSAQSDEAGRFFVGGGLGVQFGTVTVIDVSPHVGYLFTEHLAGGVGLTYQYYNDARYKPAYSTSIYGARIFGRYYFLENLIAHAEYEYQNYDQYLVGPVMPGTPERIGVHNVYLGGGYRQIVGGRTGISILVLWNVNETIYSLYSNPIIRMGVDVGL
jgi:hypothetical protein